MNNNGPVKVAIHCLAFNQEGYIRQCLDGFVMQKTSFRYVVIVHDDASTDSTAAIISEYAEKYPDAIKPVYEKANQWSKEDGSIYRIMKDAIMQEASEGEYVAFCEGDDYWTDEFKLQKQVDFLDSHKEYGLIYSRVNVFDQEKGKVTRVGGSYVANYKDLLINCNRIPTATVVIRRDLFFKYFDEIGYHSWKMGDYPVWLYVAFNSNIQFEDTIFATYRVLENSSSHFQNYSKHESFENSVYDIQLFFSQKYGVTEDEEALLREKHFERQFRIAYQYQNYSKARLYFKEINNKNLKMYVKYILSILKI